MLFSSQGLLSNTQEEKDPNLSINLEIVCLHFNFCEGENPYVVLESGRLQVSGTFLASQSFQEFDSKLI